MFCLNCLQKFESEREALVVLAWERIPGVLQSVTALVGPENAVKLARTYGGTRLYVPKHMTPAHPLAKLIGFENARVLADQFKGDRVDIPKFDDLIREARNVAILKDRALGMSVRELALKYRLTEKSISNIQKTVLKADLLNVRLALQSLQEIF